MSVRATIGIAAALLLSFPPSARNIAAQQPTSPPQRLTLDFSTALTWRPIGPASAGRVTTAVGDASRLGVFYAAVDGGGLWKTTDYGATWQPIFDAPPSGRLDVIALAPSDQQTLYAAVGQGPMPAGSDASSLYVSVDAGDTWQPLSSRWRRIRHVTVAADNHRRVFVVGQAADDVGARLHVFRSDDGGTSFTRVLELGDFDDGYVASHHQRPDVLFAWGSSSTDRGTRSEVAIFRSTDAGATWQSIAKNVPDVDALNDAYIDMAAAPDSETIVLLVVGPDDTRLYRSTDLGDTWDEAEAAGFPRVTPSMAPRIDITSGIIRVLARGLWESPDEGRTFAPVASLLSESHDRLMWLHPSLADIMLVAGSDGVAVTVNGGATWSPRASLPSADIDSLRVDAAFPYRVCATSELETTCTTGRADRGMDQRWESLPPWLTDPIPDPLNADVVFGGDVLRYDRLTQQALDVGRSNVFAGPQRAGMQLAFSADGRTLYAARESVWRTTDGGQSWTDVSPGLFTGSQDTREPAHASALVVSPIDSRTMWVGLDDGRIHVTRDAGQTWTATMRPPGEPAGIHAIEPSRFDASSAYVVTTASGASNIFRTRDAGTTWTDVNPDISAHWTFYAIREDPLRRGLLFGGTNRGAVVSFDDGDSWQPLQLNLPPTRVQDLVIKDADVIAATGGRGVWVLDDISPLRQITSDVGRAPAYIFRPSQAWRLRASATPITATAPNKEEAGGVWLTYLLGGDGADDVRLEIVDAATGDVIRQFSSRPERSSRTPELSTAAGLHRVWWDFRYGHPEPDDPTAFPGAIALPGTYQVRLVVGDQTLRQVVSIRMDPRVRTSLIDLTAQRDLARAIDGVRAALHDASSNDSGPTDAIRSLRDELRQLASAVGRADVRPSARLEALAEATLTRAAAIAVVGHNVGGRDALAPGP